MLLVELPDPNEEVRCVLHVGHVDLHRRVVGPSGVGAAAPREEVGDMRGIREGAALVRPTADRDSDGVGDTLHERREVGVRAVIFQVASRGRTGPQREPSAGARRVATVANPASAPVTWTG